MIPIPNREARIEINGVRLTEGQSATIRCAAVRWIFDLQHKKRFEGGIDEIEKLYAERLEEIVQLILKQST